MAEGINSAKNGSVFVALLVGNGITVLGLLTERFLVVAVLHVQRSAGGELVHPKSAEGRLFDN
jgi:hypothetical protein